MEKSEFKCSAHGAERAAEQLDKLADAAQRADRALADLEKRCHGGITIQIVGEICEVKISPVSEQ